jgi:hypothetical protein
MPELYLSANLLCRSHRRRSAAVLASHNVHAAVFSLPQNPVAAFVVSLADHRYHAICFCCVHLCRFLLVVNAVSAQVLIFALSGLLGLQDSLRLAKHEVNGLLGVIF